MTAGSLVEPAFRTVPEFEFTLGPQVGRLCEEAGFPPDAQQQLCLDVIFARRPDRHLAAQDFTVVAPRQNLKTGLFKQAAIGWLWLMDERLVVWSAHEYGTATESFEDMADLVDGSLVLRKRVRHVHQSTGREAIELRSGARLKFRARTRTAARGLAAPKLVMDEAWALTAAQLGSLLPLILAQQDAQVLYGSSAVQADSDELRRIATVGRAGSDPSAGYLEWADVRPLDCVAHNCEHLPGMAGCSMDDQARWFAANPSLGKRNPLENLRKLRAKLPPAEFGRECLGWWDDPVVGRLIDPVRWAALTDPDSVVSGPPIYALDVSLDIRWAALAMAGRRADGLIHVSVDNRPGPGLAWVVPRCRQLMEQYGARFLLDKGGPAWSLAQDLEDAGVTVLEMNLSDVRQACGMFLDSIAEGRLRHRGQPDLDAAVAVAGPRPVGEGGPVFGRKTGEITSLNAVAFAHWWAVSNAYDVLQSVI